MAKLKLLSVLTEIVPDDDPDSSYLGKFGEPEKDEFYVERRMGRLTRWSDPESTLAVYEGGGVFLGRNCYEYFIPANQPKTPDEYQYALEDWRRAESLNDGEWHYVGVAVAAVVRLPGGNTFKVSSGGLWGIESDSGVDYFREVAEEQLIEILPDLKALGFSERKVRSMFKAEVEA